MRHLDKVYCTATIRESPGSAPVELHLKLDADDRFRWYTAAGRDTEIHASTLPAAVAIGYTAWQSQEFTIPRAIIV
jgi:hypothetical protein